MAGLLSNFRNTMIVSVVLALIMIYAFSTAQGPDANFWTAVFRWMHVFFGILWIGLLYYFNFVQARVMKDIPAEMKPAISKHIAPEALFWFRWAALLTVLMGIVIAWSRGSLAEILSLGFVGGFDKQYALMGIGAWLGIIMFVNVWGVIWPNQKIALGMKEADADAKAKAAALAGQFSRINTLLSLPMLTSMTMYQTIYG